MEFFNNKENETLKFKINSEGIDMGNVEARLILMTKENKNYLFIGEIHNDICKFDVPKLESFNKGDEGKIKFEIISEDLYFPVWEDKFSIKTKANIKVEEMIKQIIEEDKTEKKKTVQAILENTTPTEKIVKKESTEKVADPGFSSDKKEPEEEKVPIKHFNEFF